MLNARFKTAAMAGIVLFLGLATAAVAGPPTTTKTAPATYECSKCHMKVTAAVAKKDKFKDPMDGGKFILLKPAAKKAGTSMSKMKM